MFAIKTFRYFLKRRVHLVYDFLNYTHPRTWWTSTKNNSELITKAFFINLASRSDRLLNILRQFQKISLIPERVSAVCINSMDDFESRYPEYFRLGTSEFLRTNINGPLGYIGCYLSHIKAIELCPSDDCYTLVCEDDLEIISPSFLYTIEMYIKKIYFDVLLLDPQGDYLSTDCIARNIYKVSKSAPFYYGSHAYVIRNSSKSKILNAFKNFSVDSPDHVLCNISNSVNVYAVRTSLCRPKGFFGSDMSREK